MPNGSAPLRDMAGAAAEVLNGVGDEQVRRGRIWRARFGKSTFPDLGKSTFHGAPTHALHVRAIVAFWTDSYI